MPTRRVVSALLISFLLWAALTASRHTESGQSGLRAQYFPTADLTGQPARTLIDPEISDRQLLRAWRYTPPDTFSVRWSGYLFVRRPGTYTMQTTSDDGSQLYVDGRLVVDNAGSHGPVVRQGAIVLDRGPHAVLLEYSQEGGSYHMQWSWARSGGVPEEIPAWLLSPRPRGLATLVLLRVAGWLWLASALLSVVAAVAAARRLGLWPSERRELDASAAPGAFWTRPALASLALFALLATLHTWPLASDPAHLSRNDNADTVLNEWTIAWMAHQAPRHPLHLFDGNMFYPERRTVAFSEPLIVQSAMAAPLLWLGASPVLAYNVVLLAGFALTGWTMSVVMARWTGDWAAGIASGAMFAFNAHTLTRLPHLQALHAEFLPLALFSLDQLLGRPRWRAAMGLAVWMAIQALTSIYLLIFTAVAIAAAVLSRPEDWLGARFVRVVPKLLGSAAVASLVLLPFLLPYWRLYSAGFGRSIDEAGFYAAGAENFLTSPSRFHALNGVAPALFPGLVPVALALVALLSMAALRDPRARMCLAFGVVGLLLSLGPAVAPGYEFLYSTLPVLRAVRVTSRFGYLALAAIAVLGGYGAALIRRALSARAGGAAAFLAAAAIAAMAALEPLAAPIQYQGFDGVPSLYRTPADDPQAVVAELPLPSPDAPFYNAPALLDSTLNWRPLVNGYSGFVPASYVRHYLEFQTFPAREALASLASEGVTHVFVHLDRLDAGARAALDAAPSLQLLGREDDVALYRVRP